MSGGAAPVCAVCPHHCRLPVGSTGLCGVRHNRDGRIRSLVYGRIAARAVDPIEKKPLYHVLPGARCYSVGTIGCNLACSFCQNAELSRVVAPGGGTAGNRFSTPSQPADAALAAGCGAVAFTYNDPTVFYEYAVHCAARCRERGLVTAAVTAGYISPAARRRLFNAMDATNIDLKALDDDFYRRYCRVRLQPILDTLRYVQHQVDCWLEVTTLLIPGIHDQPGVIAKMGDWLCENLGPTVPWHLSAFHPAADMRDRPPTPPALLERARAVARACGCSFVYLGNTPVPDAGYTHCPQCAAVVVARERLRPTVDRLSANAGRCPHCSAPIPGIWARPTERTAGCGRRMCP